MGCCRSKEEPDFQPSRGTTQQPITAYSITHQQSGYATPIAPTDVQPYGYYPQYGASTNYPLYSYPNPPPPQGSPVVLDNVYDPDTDLGHSSSIPPPPPGYAPNEAQLYQASGYQVVGGKKKNNYFSQGSGGGVKIW